MGSVCCKPKINQTKFDNAPKNAKERNIKPQNTYQEKDDQNKKTNDAEIQ